MTHPPRLPAPARWLLGHCPVPPAARADVEADLHELFVARRRDRGVVHAYWRLSHDMASLWRQPRPAAAAARPRSTMALFGEVRDDLRYAARLFARQPAILLLAIAGLSLGLGIATAAFSLMNTAVLRGEGLADPDRAPGVLRTTDRLVSTTWTSDEFLRLRAGATRMQVEALLTETAPAGHAATGSTAPSVGVAFVSGGYFAATGGRVALGRTLEPADGTHSGVPPVVVSYTFWTSELNRDPGVVGRAVRIGRADATIVGVAARGFTLPSNRQLWMPLAAYGLVYDAQPAAAGIQVFGRLLPGATLAEAEAQLSGVAAGAGDPAVRVRLDPHAGLGRASESEALSAAVLVFAVIALVLLLACANVASVLVATAITREREMGVRAALGASRGRIVRQLVTESVALGSIAAALGFVFASWALPSIARAIEAPAGADLTPDLTVYLFLGIVTLVTGVGAGLAPAWHGRGVDLVTPLKGEGARQDRVAPRRLRSLLVMTQAAVSVLLIVLAALFVRATVRAAAIDVGFDAGGLYAVSPGLAESAVPAVSDFATRARAALQNVPGVSAATLADVTPFSNVTRSAIAGGDAARVVYFNRTRAEFFEVVGLRRVAGRTFTPGEIAANAPVAVVSQSLARAYWHDRSPLGQLLPPEIPVPPAMTLGPGGPALIEMSRPTIVGVVSDAVTTRLHERNTFAVYQPLDPAGEGSAELLMRVAPGTTGLQRAADRLRAIDPRTDVRIASVAARLEQEASRPRMLAALSSTIGAVAAVLCVIGLYGLTASVVGQRTREMGLRAALGASPRDLLRLLLWDSLRPVVVGLAAGTAAALIAGRAAASTIFFGVSPQDPLALAGGAGMLLAAALLAVLMPTRRAAMVDAAFVLRRS